MSNDFSDSEGVEEAEMHDMMEEASDLMEDASDMIEESTFGDDDMTEEEAFDTFELAFALGLGEEIGLGEAEIVLEARSRPRRDPISIKEAKAEARATKSNFSSLTGKLKCPFEQWIKDVCAGRKKVSDPVGGENSYGKEYDLYAG